MDNYFDDILDLHNRLKDDYLYDGMFNTSTTQELFNLIARNIVVKGTSLPKENEVSEAEM
jgi:hypothetical protein